MATVSAAGAVKLTDLNDYPVTGAAAAQGWLLTTASSVNDAGDIIGLGPYTDPATGVKTSSRFIYLNASNWGQILSINVGPTTVNNFDQVVGGYFFTPGVYEAAMLFHPQDATPVSMGYLPNTTSTTVYGLNNLGAAVGQARTSSGALVGFHWDASAGMVQLAGSGSGRVDVYDINDADLSVGDAPNASGTGHAFLWSGTQATDLNTITTGMTGWTLQKAEAISNGPGYIAGMGVYKNATHTFLLTPQ